MSYERIRPEFAFDQDRLNQLRSLLPEVFADGKINWDTLRAALGNHLEDAEHMEQFGLFWPGKRAARRRAAEPGVGTLIPLSNEGVNEETTRNIFIESDNLEALKLVQKAYTGRVKMIYIDPPYNTGNDFIYKDDFREVEQRYLERTGQVSDQGQSLTTNSKADGRFHSNWLNMIYPRLLLARTLLSDDGVIFVSIDDNEAHNLRPIMAEIFGEENYLITLYIQVRYGDKTLVEDANFHKLIEQVIVFGKSDKAELKRETSGYSFDKFCWKVVEATLPQQTLTLGGKKVEIFTSEQYSIEKIAPSKDNLKEVWATGKILDGNSSGRFFRDQITGRYKEDGYGALYKVYGIGDDQYDYRYFTGPKKVGATKGKYYQGVPIHVLNSSEQVKRGSPISNFYNFADSFGNCRHEGGVDFRNGKKPLAFLKKLLSLSTSSYNEEIVLDFFAGSGSTGHAVLDQNREDSGNRRFVLVQTPEPIREATNEFQTISDLSKERLRRSINQLNNPQQHLRFEDYAATEDLGFKVFNYVPSQFKQWRNYTGDTLSEVQTIFDLFETPLVADWSQQRLLWEVLLSQGFPLDSKIETLEGYTSNILLVSSDGQLNNLLVCLDSEINADVFQQIQLTFEDIFICLDSALSDETKILLAERCALKTI